MGKVLLAGAELGCSQEALIVVAMAATDPVWLTPRSLFPGCLYLAQCNHCEKFASLHGGMGFCTSVPLHMVLDLGTCRNGFVLWTLKQRVISSIHRLCMQGR